MLRPLQQLIDALRRELQQYGEFLAQLDERTRLHRHSVAGGDGWDFVAQTEALLLVRQTRERWQQQLAWAAGRPEAGSTGQWLSLIPPDYRPLVTALVEENESLWRRVGGQASEHSRHLARTREVSRQTLARLSLPPPALATRS